MSSEIKVDTISENTSANGVSIDSLAIKDGKITNLMNSTLNAADMGAGIHIKNSDSGTTNFTDADDLVIESSGVAGINIFTGTSSAGQINFGDSGANERGKLKYDHNGDVMTIHAGSTEVFRYKGLQLSTGGETAPDCDDGGLTLDQNANDNNVLTFKNSDIAHGMTDQAETDTYARFLKLSSTGGGLNITGFTEGQVGINLRGGYVLGDTAKNSGSLAPVYTDARKKSGTGFTDPASNENIFAATAGFAVKFLVDADGDLHVDGSSSLSTFDEYEDAHLVRAYDLSHGKGVIDSKFDKFVSYNHEKLADMKLVGKEEDGTPNHFINVTGMQRLHNGAIWQQYEKHQRLAEAVYEMAKEALGKDKADAILEKHDIKLLN